MSHDLSDGGAETPRFCAACGTAVRAEAHFCPSCGAPAPPAAGPSPRPVGPTVPVTPAIPVSPPSTGAKGTGTTKAKAKAAAGAAAGAGAGAGASAPGPPATTPNRQTTIALIAGGVLAALLLLGGVLLVATRGGDEQVTTDTAAPRPTTGVSPATTTPTGGQTGGEPGAGGDTSAATPLQPVSVVASNERSAVNLRCPPYNYVDYTAARLIDGNNDTGWGASSSDGTGQSVTVRFNGPRHLTSVGITPGYAKFGPRADQSCNAVNAFPFNRFVTSVQYRFDDGTTQVQNFQNAPDLQEMTVDVVTTSVTITVLGTQRPPNADDDTIISEAVFKGSIG